MGVCKPQIHDAPLRGVISIPYEEALDICHSCTVSQRPVQPDRQSSGH
jgi:hypothetical protein